jgi:hypothetical protein
MKLEKIETQLEAIIQQDKQQWTKTAQLLLKIKSGYFYLERAKSFSQYIRQLAKQFQVNESKFWRIKKAGEFYLKLYDTTDTKVISKAKTTPEQIEILIKIRTAAPPEVVESLEKKMLEGKTTRQELRDIWQTYRRLKEGRNERGRKPKNPPLDDVVQLPEAKSIKVINTLEALKNPNWVIKTIGEETDDLHIFQEVVVTEGSSVQNCIDVVGVVKESNQSPLPTIIGVEIKVMSLDLFENSNFPELKRFCHYFYVAIPNETHFIDLAKELITQQVGILCVTDEIVDGRYQVVMIRKARRRRKPHTALLGELYAECLCQALGWE